MANYYLIIPLAEVQKNNLNWHDFSSKELLGAIRKVLSGGKYITSSVADKLLSDLGPDSGHPLHELLSDREYQVLCLIASGKGDQRSGLFCCIFIFTQPSADR